MPGEGLATVGQAPVDGGTSGGQILGFARARLRDSGIRRGAQMNRDCRRRSGGAATRSVIGTGQRDAV